MAFLVLGSINANAARDRGIVYGGQAERITLIVGNSAYQHSPKLANPENDARAVAKAFRSINFDVIVGYDLVMSEFLQKLKTFSALAVKSKIAVVYFAGHGAQIGGTNYVFPVDGILESDRDVRQLIDVNWLVEDAARASEFSMVILDACRANPLVMTGNGESRSTARQRGLSIVTDTPPNVFIAYATAAGEVASDGVGEHSPFTEALLGHLFDEPTDIRLLFGRVRDQVIGSTNGQQQPFSYGSLGSLSYALKSDGHRAASPSQSSAAETLKTWEVESQVWQSTERLNTKQACKAYQNQFCPGGIFCELSSLFINELNINGQNTGKENRSKDELIDASRENLPSVEEPVSLFSDSNTGQLANPPLSYQRLGTQSITTQAASEQEIEEISFPNEVLFEEGSSSISNSMKRHLDRILPRLIDYKVRPILVVGHTSATGSRAGNKRLSTKRASSVAQYLIEFGVQHDRLRTLGFGDRKARPTKIQMQLIISA